jgi:hypothetical protein
MTSERDDSTYPDPDQVDEMVDEVLAGRVQAEDAQEAAVVESSLLRVRALSDEPLPAASRSRHLLRIRTHEPDPRAASQRRGYVPGRARGIRRRLVVLTAGAMALLLLTAGSAVAVAQDAAPDDALYGLKRTSEQVWLSLPLGSERAAEVHLALAERRLDEIRRAPTHAERLVGEGIENVEAAASERPEEAIETFVRLLGTGEDSLPEQASPAARAALHRNCVRIATKHDLGPERCGDAPEGEHPGRGLGRGQGDHPGQGRGEGEGLGRGLGQGHAEVPRGWGPGGRPEGTVGPPPGTPGHGRGGEEIEDLDG